jgi:hypothetical protein
MVVDGGPSIAALTCFERASQNLEETNLPTIVRSDRVLEKSHIPGIFKLFTKKFRDYLLFVVPTNNERINLPSKIVKP